jgi:hypothetical protein
MNKAYILCFYDLLSKESKKLSLLLSIFSVERKYEILLKSVSYFRRLNMATERQTTDDFCIMVCYKDVHFEFSFVYSFSTVY